MVRSGRNANNDLTNVLAHAGPGSHNLRVDPPNVNTGGTNQSPVAVVVESGSNGGGATYNNGGGDANGNDSTFMVTSLHTGMSMVSINAFDMNPGNPGGTFVLSQSFLNLQYHDTAGNQVRPGNGTLQYSAQSGGDPVIQFTGVTIVGSGSPPPPYTTTFTFTGSGGTGNWNSASNWTTGGPPFVPGDTAVFASNSPTGIVTLNATASVGTLQLNNGGTGSGMTISSSGPATYLAFDNLGVGPAAVLNVTAGQHTISAPVYLESPLNVNITTTAPGTGLTISGTIYGSSGISLCGGGTLTLSGQSSYYGLTNINAGTLQAGAAGAILSGSIVSIASARHWF